jgi:hypothetical protein
MNKEKFISFMQNPETLNKESMDELSYLISEFPYCQSAHILLTLSHFKEQSILFDSSLKTTAIYAANRKVLKKHIDRLSTDSSGFIFHDEGIKEKKKTEETPKKENPTPKSNTEEKVPASTEHNNVTKIVENKEAENTIKSNSANSSPKVTETKTTTEFQKEKDQNNIKETPREEKGTIEFKAKSKRIKQQTIPEMEKEPMDIHKSKSIADLKKIVEKRIREIESDKNTKDKKETRAEKPKSNKNDLIDTFIKNQPAISRQKVNFYDAKEVAANSIVDQENIVSETLANIYLDQCHYEKAINIYEKLNLKYPEKSSYFAALIEKARLEDINKK